MERRRASLAATLGGVAVLVARVLLEPTPGAVPARFAYVLWGPWGIWPGRRLDRPTLATPAVELGSGSMGTA